MVPFYLFSQKELAPQEDQSVIFAIIQAAPNATLDQTKLFALAGPRRLPPRSRKPRASSRSRTRRAASPGWSTKPWNQRERSTAQLLLASAAGFSKIPGVRVDPAAPAGAARRQRLPRGLRRRVHRRAAAARRVRQPAGREGVHQRPVHVRRHRPEVRPAAGRGRLRPRQAALAGRGPVAGGARPVHDARRRLREPLQRAGPQLQGHPADPAGRSAHGRPAEGDLRHGRGQQAGAALDLRHAEDDDRAAGTEAVPAAERRADPGRHPAARVARHRAEDARGRGGEDPAARAGVQRGLRRRVAAAPHRGQQLPRHVPAVGDPDLPRARGAVRELPRPVHHPRRVGAARPVRIA